MFAEMRRNQPVFAAEVQGRPIYLVLRYDDVCSVLRDPETFSSSVMRQVMGPVMGEQSWRWMAARIPCIAVWSPTRSARNRSVATQRSSCNPWSTSWSTASVARRQRRAGLGVDATLSAVVITRMLGVPVRDYAQFHQWSLDLIGYRAEAPESGLAASRALKQTLAPILAERRPTRGRSDQRARARRGRGPASVRRRHLRLLPAATARRRRDHVRLLATCCLRCSPTPTSSRR